ncbi:MAG: hypothetical protein ABWY06_12745 [Pseudomonas sp.]|uniref:hypothetical protein n=1 Tax=Pseudomonas sp. TaxID=306 RepID=UPI0033983445
MPLVIANLAMLGADMYLSVFSIAMLTVPASYFVARCLFTSADDLSNVIHLTEARVVYVLSFLTAGLLILFAQPIYAVPALLSGLMYSCSERIVGRALRWFPLFR